MKKSLIILAILFGMACCQAQRSIHGTLVLNKSENKDFVLRNTTVMLIAGTRRDSTSIHDDLTFSFPDLQAPTAVLYLKSPVISSHAVTKVGLRKRKSTNVSLDYAMLHRISQDGGQSQRMRDCDEDQVATTAFIVIRVLADLLIIFRH